MGPEEFADLLRKVQEASRRGVPLARLDEEIANRTDGEFSDVRSLAQAARDAGVSQDQLAPPPSPEAGGGGGGGQGLFSGIGRAGRIAGEVGSFGLLDEAAAGLRGTVAAAGAVLPGGRSPGEAFQQASRQELEASRRRLQQAEEGAGLGTKVLGFLGGLIGPGAAAGRLVAGGRTAGARAARGAGAGAAEGGLFGFGSAEGSPGERLPEAGVGAGLGAVGGAAIPAGIDAARVVGRATKKAGQSAKKAARGLEELEDLERAERRIGPDLADEIREGAGVEGKPSQLRREIEESRKGLFGKLDEIEEIENEGLRKVLQSDDAAPFVPEDVATGKRPPSFPEAQGAARQLNKAQRAALRNGDAASFQRLVRAEREVRGRLSEAVEGFDEANKAFAQQAARGRALEAGEDAFTSTADEVQEAFNALETDAEKTAFREGLASKFLSRLDDITAIPSTLKKIRNAPETRAKLQTIFNDDEDAFNAFVDAARSAENVRDRAKAGRLVERELMRGLFVSLAKGAGIGIGIGGTASLLSN